MNKAKRALKRLPLRILSLLVNPFHLTPRKPDEGSITTIKCPHCDNFLKGKHGTYPRWAEGRAFKPWVSRWCEKCGYDDRWDKT